MNVIWTVSIVYTNSNPCKVKVPISAHRTMDAAIEKCDLINNKLRRIREDDYEAYEVSEAIRLYVTEKDHEEIGWAIANAEAKYSFLELEE